MKNSKATFWDGADLIHGVIVKTFFSNGKICHEIKGNRHTQFGEKKVMDSITCYDSQLIHIS